MAAFGFAPFGALIGFHILNKAHCVSKSGVVVKALKVRDEFVFNSAYDMVAVNRTENQVSLLCLLKEFFFELSHNSSRLFFVHPRFNVVDIDSNVLDPQGDKPAIVFNS